MRVVIVEEMRRSSLYIAKYGYSVVESDGELVNVVVECTEGERWWLCSRRHALASRKRACPFQSPIIRIWVHLLTTVFLRTKFAEETLNAQFGMDETIWHPGCGGLGKQFPIRLFLVGVNK